MTSAYTVQDSRGRLLAAFAAATRLEVARKVVARPCDAFRLQVSPSYRALFERALKGVLTREGWRIVPLSRASLKAVAGEGSPHHRAT